MVLNRYTTFARLTEKLVGCIAAVPATEKRKTSAPRRPWCRRSSVEPLLRSKSRSILLHTVPEVVAAAALPRVVGISVGDLVGNGYIRRKAPVLLLAALSSVPH